MKRYIVVLLYLVLVLGPLLAGVVYSMLYSTGSIGLLSKGFSLVAWQNVLTDDFVKRSFLSTIFVATISLVIGVAAALFVVLKSNWLRRSGIAGIMLHIPLAFPPMVAAFLMFQLLYKGGLLSRIFYQLGLTTDIADFPGLVNDNLNIGVILCMALFVFPFFVVFFVQKMEISGMNRYVTLAASLGAGRYQTDMKIVIPLLLRHAWFNIALYWLILFGNFEIPLILGRQHPAQVSVLISQKFTKYDLGDLPEAYAISLLYVLVVLVVFLLFLFKNRKIQAI